LEHKVLHYKGHKQEIAGNYLQTGQITCQDMTGHKIPCQGSGQDAEFKRGDINELESLVDCSMHSPALPSGHPFEDIEDAYWSSTTSMFEPDWAWALYLTKGATGVGQKRGPHFSVWAVCDMAESGN